MLVEKFTRLNATMTVMLLIRHVCKPSPHVSLEHLRHAMKVTFVSSRMASLCSDCYKAVSECTSVIDKDEHTISDKIKRILRLYECPSFSMRVWMYSGCSRWYFKLNQTRISPCSHLSKGDPETSKTGRLSSFRPDNLRRCPRIPCRHCGYFREWGFLARNRYGQFSTWSLTL